MFQSSPSPKAGSYVAWFASAQLFMALFQSSPSPKAGSYAGKCKGPEAGHCFNPLPARRPGATLKPCPSNMSNLVSILSQPEGRELRELPVIYTMQQKVSILSQPEGRELLQEFLRIQTDEWFQSSPSPKAGSYPSPAKNTPGLSSFNPLPARRPGATQFFRRNRFILPSFNPLPARRPGATYPSHVPDTPASVSILSQPEGRELRRIRCSLACRTRFNPLPARRPGATQKLRLLARWAIVSILSQPEGRELLMAS